MSYRTTEAADRDIAGIYADGETQFGTKQAERYQDGLFDLFDLIGDNPRMARERPEFTPPIRVHPYGAHVVIYTLGDAGAPIVRVLPGRAGPIGNVGFNCRAAAAQFGQNQKNLKYFSTASYVPERATSPFQCPMYSHAGK